MFGCSVAPLDDARMTAPTRVSSDHHSSDQPSNRPSDHGCRGALGESALPELCGLGGLCVRIPASHGAALLSQTRRFRREGDTENHQNTPRLLFSGFSVFSTAGRFFGKFQASAYAARLEAASPEGGPGFVRAAAGKMPALPGGTAPLHDSTRSTRQNYPKR